MKKLLLIPWIIMTLGACTTTKAVLPRDPGESTGKGEISPIQQDLVDSAQWALGKNRLTVGDRRFNMDCTGVVLAIYYRSGIDLSREFGSYTGGGVQRLHSYMDDLDLLYRTPYPRPGDLLFWDDTYDHNGDGIINDPLTHVGMVVSVDSRGNIRYIHHNYRKGIILAKMNLLEPDNLSLNDPMRARYAEKGHAPRWLSSHLLKEEARAYEVADL